MSIIARKYNKFKTEKDNLFYEKAMEKILEFCADEMTTVDFEKVKRNSEKLPVYKFKKNRKNILNRRDNEYGI